MHVSHVKFFTYKLSIELPELIPVGPTDMLNTPCCTPLKIWMESFLNTTSQQGARLSLPPPPWRFQCLYVSSIKFNRRNNNASSTTNSLLSTFPTGNCLPIVAICYSRLCHKLITQETAHAIRSKFTTGTVTEQWVCKSHRNQSIWSPWQSTTHPLNWTFTLRALQPLLPVQQWFHTFETVQTIQKQHSSHARSENRNNNL